MTARIFITGAGRGLGLELVHTFNDAGWTVFAAAREPAETLEAVARKSDRVRVLTLDVTQPASVSAAARRLEDSGNGLDVLVNNAAILPEAGRGLLADTNIEVGLRVFDVNSLGPLRVTQALLPAMKRGTRKLIVNVSSEAGSIADCWRKDDFLYCMSKAALNMQTAILKNALAQDDFRVLAVHPGWMRTEMGGPNADIDAKEAAAGVFRLISEERTPDAPFYVDYRDQPLRW